MSVCRVALEGFINGSDQTRNVFTFDCGAHGLPTNLAIADWLDTLYSAGFLSIIGNIWQTARFIVEEPIGLTAWEYRAEAPYIRAGSNSGDTVPQQSAAVVIGVTASRRRGKKFIPCITESNQANGVLSAGVLSALTTYASAFQAPLISGVISFPSGVCKPDGSDFLPFTSARVNRIMGTQTRRKQGRGS